MAGSYGKMDQFHEMRRDLQKTSVPNLTVVVELSAAWTEYTDPNDPLKKRRRIELKLSDAERYTRKDLSAVVAKYFDGTLGSGTIVPQDPNRLKPLGIKISASTNVVIVLKDDMDWRFRAGGPGVTCKADYEAANYGPWHFDRSGRQLDHVAPGNGCQAVAFTALSRGFLERQSFNFHIELLQSDGLRWLEVVLDPDVPDTGNEGFPFLPPAPVPSFPPPEPISE